ncbi:MAG: hypothetical protein ACK4NW_00580 [Roseinatronobacter sp.]
MKALNLSLKDLDIALLDLQKVYNERWPITSLKNLSVAFAKFGAFPAGVALALGAPIDLAFLAGATATITHSTISASFSKKHEDNPFSYAFDARRL